MSPLAHTRTIRSMRRLTLADDHDFRAFTITISVSHTLTPPNRAFLCLVPLHNIGHIKQRHRHQNSRIPHKISMVHSIYW